MLMGLVVFGFQRAMSVYDRPAKVVSFTTGVKAD